MVWAWKTKMRRGTHAAADGVARRDEDQLQGVAAGGDELL